MVVYLEYAFLENFFIDFSLLYLSVKGVNERIVPFRIVLAACLGGIEAIVFPLLSIPQLFQYVIKALGGTLLVLVALSTGIVKNYVKAIVIFFLTTFALGGFLTAIYSFFKIEYVEGSGYLIESIPVALLFGTGTMFLIFLRHLMKQFQRKKLFSQCNFSCEIIEKEKKISGICFADSGNLLQFQGRSVCIISAVAAYVLFLQSHPIGNVYITTVNGRKKTHVFQAERLTIQCEGRTVIKERALFAVGAIHIKNCLLLLPGSYLEELNENSVIVAKSAAKDKGERKRRPLFMRKRSAASAVIHGRGEQHASTVGER